jgi:hypothetical protein
MAEGRMGVYRVALTQPKTSPEEPTRIATRKPAKTI